MDTPATSAAPENYYKMPPIGMTETRVMIGQERRSQFTVRCGDHNCWFVGHGGNSNDAQALLDQHTCPTLPHRNELPTGRSTLEKLWDEMDDVTAALIEKREYNGMSGDQLTGYAKGIAFNLSMFTHPYFHSIKEISKEAGARYKMSKGTIPWRPTPSYRYNPLPLTANVVQTTPAEKRTPAARKKNAPAPAPKVNLEASAVAAIRAAGASGMFTVDELASMYKATPQQVQEIIG
jgi:hypothetical protein